MMLERYRDATGEIEWWVAERVLQMLGVRSRRRRNSLFNALDASGHDQADLVLCLLRLGCLRHVERLVGHPIRYFECSYRVAPPPIAEIESKSSFMRRRVVRVDQNPRLPTTKAFQRYRQIRVGLTVSQLLVRGVRKRDVRWAEQRGYLRLERIAG